MTPTTDEPRTVLFKIEIYKKGRWIVYYEKKIIPSSVGEMLQSFMALLNAFEVRFTVTHFDR